MHLSVFVMLILNTLHMNFLLYHQNSISLLAMDKGYSKSVDHPAWPERRYGHAATFIQTHQALVISGGAQKDSYIVSDCWIFEFVSKSWEKVR